MESFNAFLFLLFSDSQTEDNVIVKWRTLNGGLIVPENLEIPQYDLGKVIVKNCSRRYNTGPLNREDFVRITPNEYSPSVNLRVRCYNW